MKSIFLDASGLIAVTNMDDQWHDRAEAAWRELIVSGAPLVTTSLVLFELGDGLSRVNQRPLAIDLYTRLRQSPRVQVVPASLEQEVAAWELFRRRGDKDWGVTDCASFFEMNRLGIEEAFSVDRHFEQAGFRRLIRS
jgi:uncharacterized protein